MSHFPQVPRAATAAATLALAALVAIGGVPMSVFAGTTCGKSGAHCQNQAVAEDHCARSAVAVSCICDRAEQPAHSNSSRGSDSVSTGVSQALPSWVVQPRPSASLPRPDYPLTQGRHFVPLPILHASLLI